LQSEKLFPTCIHLSGARQPDFLWLEHLNFEPGDLYVMDRGYMDFRHLYLIAQAGAFFVTRAKAVKTQIGVALCVYLMAAIIHKELSLPRDRLGAAEKD